jgi:hypothetical protein
MKRILFTAAVMSLSFGAAVLASSVRTNALRTPQALLASLQQQSSPQQQVQTFTGTISKSRDQYVLTTDDATKSSYVLDDQKTASKFEGKRVEVSGTLDAADGMIRVQSIKEAKA